MPIYKFLLLFILCVATFVASAHQHQSAKIQEVDSMFKNFANDQEVLKYGFEALHEGRHEEAFAAFEYGARHNHLASQWKLAKMFQLGIGGERDNITAYRLFEKIAQRFYESEAKPEDYPYIKDALVALGDYSLQGIGNSDNEIIANPQQAEFYYFRAAALYNDTQAQFKLGKLYASDLLGKKRVANAMRWYELACQKGHTMAQAELGDLLFYGSGGQENIVKGLAYLAYASRNLKCWECRKRYREAFAKATTKQRRLAIEIAANLTFPEKTE